MPAGAGAGVVAVLGIVAAKVAGVAARCDAAEDADA